MLYYWIVLIICKINTLWQFQKLKDQINQKVHKQVCAWDINAELKGKPAVSSLVEYFYVMRCKRVICIKNIIEVEKPIEFEQHKIFNEIKNAQHVEINQYQTVMAIMASNLKLSIYDAITRNQITEINIQDYVKIENSIKQSAYYKCGDVVMRFLKNTNYLAIYLKNYGDLLVIKIGDQLNTKPIYRIQLQDKLSFIEMDPCSKNIFIFGSKSIELGNLKTQKIITIEEGTNTEVQILNSSQNLDQEDDFPNEISMSRSGDAETKFPKSDTSVLPFKYIFNLFSKGRKERERSGNNIFLGIELVLLQFLFEQLSNKIKTVSLTRAESPAILESQNMKDMMDQCEDSVKEEGGMQDIDEEEEEEEEIRMMNEDVVEGENMNDNVEEEGEEEEDEAVDLEEDDEDDDEEEEEEEDKEKNQKTNECDNMVIVAEEEEDEQVQVKKPIKIISKKNVKKNDNCTHKDSTTPVGKILPQNANISSTPNNNSTSLNNLNDNNNGGNKEEVNEEVEMKLLDSSSYALYLRHMCTKQKKRIIGFVNRSIVIYEVMVNDEKEISVQLINRLELNELHEYDMSSIQMSVNIQNDKFSLVIDKKFMHIFGLSSSLQITTYREDFLSQDQAKRYMNPMFWRDPYEKDRPEYFVYLDNTHLNCSVCLLNLKTAKRQIVILQADKPRNLMQNVRWEGCIGLIGEGGSLFILERPRHYYWQNFSYRFRGLEKNTQYIEKEDEFDLREQENLILPLTEHDFDHLKTNFTAFVYPPSQKILTDGTLLLVSKSD